MLISAELARTSRQRQGHDGGQLDERDPMVVMACSITSR
jgi:hypothetical protein